MASGGSTAPRARSQPATIAPRRCNQRQRVIEPGSPSLLRARKPPSCAVKRTAATASSSCYGSLGIARPGSDGCTQPVCVLRHSSAPYGRYWRAVIAPVSAE